MESIKTKKNAEIGSKLNELQIITFCRQIYLKRLRSKITFFSLIEF